MFKINYDWTGGPSNISILIQNVRLLEHLRYLSFKVETKGNYDPAFQAYAAGYIEGKIMLFCRIRNII